MTTQVVTRGKELQAWVRFLRAHAAVTRQFNAELVHRHGLTLNDYEVLLHLKHAPDGMLRRVDLAGQVLLTPSGITRLLEGLERAGYVVKASCPSDARVTYAKLTPAGFEKLAEAAETHVGGVRSLFADRYSEDELETLSALLERLPSLGADSPADCS